MINSAWCGLRRAGYHVTLEADSYRGPYDGVGNLGRQCQEWLNDDFERAQAKCKKRNDE
jgi:hypothetical protein